MKKIHQYSKQGDFIKSFDNPEVAASSLGISKATIYKSAGNNVSTKEHIFVYAVEDEEPAKKLDIADYKIKKGLSPIITYDNYGLVVKRYKSIMDASIDLGLNVSRLHDICRGEDKTSLRIYYDSEIHLDRIEPMPGKLHPDCRVKKSNKPHGAGIIYNTALDALEDMPPHITMNNLDTAITNECKLLGFYWKKI